MTILESLARLIAPHVCLGCGAEEDMLICGACKLTLPIIPSRCYRCKAVTRNNMVCRECTPRTPLHQVIVYTHYHELAKQLVRRTKYERARTGAAEMAILLSELIPRVLPSDVILVHIPTATQRVRSRGYDHAALITRHIGQSCSLPHQTLLRRVGQAHQVGATRTARLAQLQSAFRAVRPEQIRGKHIVLIDDVLTTGATIESAARILRRAGAKHVSAVVFAQA